MKTVTFTNADAITKQFTMQVNEESIPFILMLYNSFYEGDLYTMSIDGVLVPTLDGEIFI